MNNSKESKFNKIKNLSMAICTLLLIGYYVLVTWYLQLKKKDQYYHPRLYISVSKDSCRLYSVKYYGNKINKYGNRLLIANNENLSSQIADSDDTLLSLNKKEYLNLILYMKKQEKVLVLYRKKK